VFSTAFRLVFRQQLALTCFAEKAMIPTEVWTYMWETGFKLLALAGLLTFVGARLYFQGRVKGVRRVEQRAIRRDKFFYNLVAAAYLLILPYTFGLLELAHLELPLPWRWAGAVLVALGVGLFVWAHLALGRNWSGVLEISQGHQLITWGPYRWVRHPMYSAFFLLAAGFGLLSANWIVGGSLLLSTALMYGARVAGEEQMMLEHFGAAYEQYMRRSGRILPQLWNGKNQPTNSPSAEQT
jgi:protein-S-isoprenylcysteine O-methyltransferase Ste14